MNLIINNDGLKNNEIDEFGQKARAILTDDNNNILVANYGGVYLLPGGKIDDNETPIQALIRELEEETGTNYNEHDFAFLTTIQSFQKNYPKRDGSLHNRLVETHYFQGRLKRTIPDNQQLTDKEQKDNFKLRLMSLDELTNVVANSNSNNPRSKYFIQELLLITNYYNSGTKHISKQKKLTKVTVNNSEIIE